MSARDIGVITPYRKQVWLCSRAPRASCPQRRRQEGGTSSSRDDPAGLPLPPALRVLGLGTRHMDEPSLGVRVCPQPEDAASCVLTVPHPPSGLCGPAVVSHLPCLQALAPDLGKGFGGFPWSCQGFENLFMSLLAIHVS